MLFKASLAVTFLQVLSASATWTAYQEYLASLPKHGWRRDGWQQQGDRPSFNFHPNQPFGGFPQPPARNKVCVVQSHNDFKTDDSPYIVNAINQCNNGGRVVFPAGVTYVIGTALNLTYLNHIDLDIQAYIQFSNDTTYWQANGFYQVFQNATTFFQIGGNDVNVYGSGIGMLDGNGQIWYDLYHSNIYIRRPILVGTVGLHNSAYSDLKLRYSPQYYNWVANSTSVVFQGISINGASQDNISAANTDGWDTYRSSNLVIQNSNINNQDDCVSFKPNSTDIVVQNLYCNGSHGISVGSLGQYIGETDIVENILVQNVTMNNTSTGARIKVWPGIPSALSGDLQGGGGTGAVKNITYTDMVVNDVEYAIEVTQCYGQSNLTLCDQFPSSLTISDVSITNVRGTTNKKFAPISGYVVCSSPSVCSGITLDGIAVVSEPSGVENEFTCGDVDQSLLHGINCTATNKGTA